LQGPYGLLEEKCRLSDPHQQFTLTIHGEVAGIAVYAVFAGILPGKATIQCRDGSCQQVQEAEIVYATVVERGREHPGDFTQQQGSPFHGIAGFWTDLAEYGYGAGHHA